jgi:hypothetical protein
MSKTFNDFKDLSALAKENNFVVTSAKGGQHNVGSKHYLGLAIDVRTRGKSESAINEFMKICRAHGLIVRDERTRPTNQKVWSGAHLHIEI